jgi:hypothetical protein
VEKKFPQLQKVSLLTSCQEASPIVIYLCEFVSLQYLALNFAGSDFISFSKLTGAGIIHSKTTNTKKHFVSTSV